MGSLGAGTLNAASDLDLIVIYDPQDAESSDGKRPLNTRPYYARLTQALITALTAQMAEGRLFEVDMRLRPSGNQGPVATSWPAFQSYQREEAWIWEHLALTRAAVIAGPESLGNDIEVFRREVLSQPRPVSEVARDVADMRRRIQEAKPAGSVLEVKVGPGRLQEIDLLAQAGALLKGQGASDRAQGLDGAAEAGLIDHDDAQDLAETGALLSNLHTCVRLLSATAVTEDQLGLAAQEFLSRSTGHASFDALTRDVQARYDRADTVLSAALAPYSKGDAGDEG
jgi:glutamate-ammonia-ligase adenylyltransferase